MIKPPLPNLCILNCFLYLVILGHYYSFNIEYWLEIVHKEWLGVAFSLGVPTSFKMPRYHVGVPGLNTWLWLLTPASQEVVVMTEVGSCHIRGKPGLSSWISASDPLSAGHSEEVNQ